MFGFKLPNLTLYAIVFAVGALLSGIGTYKVVSGNYAKQKLEAVERAIEQANEQRAEDEKLFEDISETRETIRIVYRERKEKADEVAKQTAANVECVVAPDYERVWNAANEKAGKIKTDGSDAAVRRNDSNPGNQP